MKPFGNQLLAEFIDCKKKVLNDKKSLERILREGIEQCGIELKAMTAHQFEPIGITLICIVSESHIALHTYPEAGHICIDIFTCSSEYTKPQLLLQFLKEKFQPKTSRIMKITRGNPIAVKEKNWITTIAGYGFETRYHIKKSVVSRHLKYQKINIIDNENFGRMLFLDNELQIAEKDAHIYYGQIIQPLIQKKIPLKNVAILGGGDGGVLYEILKYHPKQVHLVDIEKEVIQLCKKHLRKICHDAFVQPNVQIVIDDANEFLSKNRMFEIIIYDLTMHPSSITQLDRKDFLNKIFKNIAQALNKGGMLSLHCCPIYDEETLKILKKVLNRYFKDIVSREIFIPSFCEKLVFVTAKKLAG